MNFQQKILSKEKANLINNNLENILLDINGLVQENISLKESQGVPTHYALDARERISNNLF